MNRYMRKWAWKVDVETLLEILDKGRHLFMLILSVHTFIKNKYMNLIGDWLKI